MTDDIVTRSLELEISLESLEAVHHLLELWWEEVADVSMRARVAFETAVIEIAGNVIEHTRQHDTAVGRLFTLELTADPEKLLAVFQDNGLPASIDLSTVSMADEDDENGRGLALAKAVLDRLEYEHVDGRNVWQLECRRG